MIIAIVAANGRSGDAFVRAALAAGHTVRAGVRRHHSFSEHPNLTIVHCDASKQSDITRLITGSDAVVNMIGHIAHSPAFLQTEATKKIITAMKKTNITRLISLTGTGVRFPGDHITFIDRILNAAISLVDPKRITDGKSHVEVIKNSGLEWSVLRVLKLTNGRPKAFALTEHGPTKLFTSRYEVAEAALQLLENDSFIGSAPIISKA